MLKFIDEFRRYIEITGFKDTKIGDPGEFLLRLGERKPSDVDVQFFDADRVATWEHLYFAALNALTVFENQHNISKSLAMETLLCAAAEKQIVRATEAMGIRPTSRRIAILIIGARPAVIRSTCLRISRYLCSNPEDRVLELSESKMSLIQKIFNIKNTELETVTRNNDTKRALVDLVIEKMALSTIKR